MVSTAVSASSRKTEASTYVAALERRDPSECLKELLALPVRLENVTLKRPSLNDVFLATDGAAIKE